ncbi:hypothetical protein BLS_005071 [Venturia inaequalis]|nr:hypothetical protein BLS_005071 [Venturia inaequalis]KAE9979868.1 hypothetical protein EG328_000626 [Venturia inaequalis]RDI82959.1 hypothetical protein Vi05172_g6827 [Venturia inaequalis]
MYSSLPSILLLTATTLASPLAAREAVTAVTRTMSSTELTPWNAGAVNTFLVHSSCNATLRAQLERGLEEAVELARHAKEHLLFWGRDSPFVTKYFGEESTATPLGWYERIVSADKAGMLFRCDDPDKNCATQDKWAGHWRGENATLETVICPRSFELRRSLESVCGLGYTVTGSPLNTFWATDLLHRMFHVPKINENKVDHYAEDYEAVIELTKTHSNSTVFNSDSLQYFAIDVYANDIAAPGVGCHGNEPEPKNATAV